MIFKREQNKMASTYVEKLIKTVIMHSESKNWEDAVKEWEIFDCEEDESAEEACLCGKEHIRYLFTIKNSCNGAELFPIGSSCIKKFDRQELKEEVNVREGMFKLLHAVGDNKYLLLSADLFSRKILRALYEQGAFAETSYNNYDGKADYEFLLKMFNKRDKSSITEKQDKKIKAILLNSIKPFLLQQLTDKVQKK